MMKVLVIDDAQILEPNLEHQNFTHSDDEVIKKGSIIEGQTKLVMGKRRGKPFCYRLFVTKDEDLIFNKNVKPMQTTEVTLGADGDMTQEDAWLTSQGAVTPAVINLSPAEIFNKTKTVGIVIGGISAFAYCKYKKCSKEKMATFIAVGSLAGWVAGFLIDQNRQVIATPSV